MAAVEASVYIAEIYLPPGITAQGNKYGLRLGDAMDFRIGYDFHLEDDREMARHMNTQ